MPILHKLLSIDVGEVDCERRGFSCPDRHLRHRLENVGRYFLHGYHAALRHADLETLAAGLNEVPLEPRGFAYEGAGMALALRDSLSLSGGALARFISGGGKTHIYMLHVGAGWAFARLPWLRRRIESVTARMHPVLRWLVIDGYGFHQGYFHFRAPQRVQASLKRLSVNARHVFYQGLGRSLWFSHGAQLESIANAISMFPALYRQDGWSGVGLACGYAGGISEGAIAQLGARSCEYASALAQGAAFAAKARRLAGNPAAHTELACLNLCGMDAGAAASFCDQTFNHIDPLHACPYQHWRRLLRESLALSAEIPLRGKPHESAIPVS